MTVNEDLLSFQISQQIRWLRVANSEAREIRKIVASADKTIAALILNETVFNRPNYSSKRLKALKDKLDEIISAIHKDVKEFTYDSVDTHGKAASAIETEALKRAIPVAIDIVTPNLVALRASLAIPMQGAKLDEWLADLKANDLKRSFRTIQEGLVSGTATDDIVRAVVGSRSLRYKDGIREVSKRGAELLVRTFLNHATSMARQSVWEANMDLISEVRWVSTLDGRTSDICRYRDGKTYPVDSGPRPPAHPRCRSTTVAVTKSWRELGFDIDEMEPGTRASMNGQVPAALTYYEWLASQTASFQKEVLGARRYRLWKQGKVTPDKFHDDAGNLYTLQELEKRMPDAFKMAFEK